MIKSKIQLGNIEKSFIMSERKRTSYSAEYVSENIGHSKSWLAQEIYVESTQEVDAGEPIGNEYW